MGDMDIWVERTTENYHRIKRAFSVFGMPVFDMTEENFLHHSVWDVFTFGVPSIAIDVMIKLEGMNFADVFSRAVIFKDENLQIRTILRNDLISAKKKSRKGKRSK